MTFKLTIIEGKGQGREFFFSQSRVKIGRLPDNDLVLYDTGVSRNHCEIMEANGSFSVRDLGSANGTMLNGTVTAEAHIERGDHIGVGPITFEFVLAEEAPQGKRRFDLFRPDDLEEREAMHGDDTRALRLEQYQAKRQLDEAGRTATGSFTSRRRTLLRRWHAVPRSTRGALGIGAGVVVIGIVLSAYIIRSRPPPDRSMEVFPIDDNTALLSFGAGKVKVSTPDRVNFKFNYKGGKVTLSYAAGGVESAEEVSIQMNGGHIGHVEPAPRWTQGMNTEVPRKFLQPGINILTFDNTHTPARKERWGIAQLKIIQRKLPPADIKQAKAFYNLGKGAYETRSVAPQNLARAREYYRQAALNLEALDEPPPLMADIQRGLQRTEDQLNNIFNSHMFAAQKAARFGDSSTAEYSLRELLSYYPDPEDRRHKEVKDRLVKLLGRDH